MYTRLADHLVTTGKPEKAEEVLDQLFKVLPDEVVPIISAFQISSLIYITENIRTYYNVGTPSAKAKADKLVLRVGEIMGQQFAWWNKQPDHIMEMYKDDAFITLSQYNDIVKMLDDYLETQKQFFNQIPKVDRLMAYFVNSVRENQAKLIRGGWDKNQQGIMRAFFDLREIANFCKNTGNSNGASLAQKALETNLGIIESFSSDLAYQIRGYIE
jgi:hypothetical protein